MQRSFVVRQGGAIRSENVGMSNRKGGESPPRRKSKVSLAMTINQGLGGPNPSTERWTRDGQTVNIPSLQFFFAKVTKSSNLGRLLDFCSWHKEQSKCCENFFLRKGKSKRALFPEKLSRVKGIESVPKTDTGGLVQVYQGERAKLR